MRIFTKLTQHALAATFLFSLSGHALSGWQADREEWLAGWRTGKVIQIETVSASSPATITECISKPGTSISTYQRVTLRYSQTRRPHQHEVIVPHTENLHPGDRVRFNLNTCPHPELAPLSS